MIATSQPYLDGSLALAPWRDKTSVVPLGIAGSPSVAPNAALWPSGSGLRLLAVGRLSRYKGFDVLIEALVRVPDARLLIVGDGECAADLRALVETRGLGHRIALGGALSDDQLASAYATAEAFVLPSLDRGEAFGLVLLEAMRAGLAVVASDIAGSGVGFVVADGETGLLSPPGDIAALAATIARLDDEHLRTRLGESGRQRWRAQFMLDTSAQRIHEIYREVRNVR